MIRKEDLVHFLVEALSESNLAKKVNNNGSTHNPSPISSGYHHQNKISQRNKLKESVNEWYKDGCRAKGIKLSVNNQNGVKRMEGNKTPDPFKTNPLQLKKKHGAEVQKITRFTFTGTLSQFANGDVSTESSLESADEKDLKNPITQENERLILKESTLFLVQNTSGVPVMINFKGLIQGVQNISLTSHGEILLNEGSFVIEPHTIQPYNPNIVLYKNEKVNFSEIDISYWDTVTPEKVNNEILEKNENFWVINNSGILHHIVYKLGYDKNAGYNVDKGRWDIHDPSKFIMAGKKEHSNQSLYGTAVDSKIASEVYNYVMNTIKLLPFVKLNEIGAGIKRADGCKWDDLKNIKDDSNESEFKINIAQKGIVTITAQLVNKFYVWNSKDAAKYRRKNN